MPKLEIHPFSDEFLDDAARLLRDRHEQHRRAESLLADVHDYAGQIQPRTGAVATRGGRVVAYLVADVGERAAVGLGGCAASEPEAVRDLYATLAGSWPAHHQVMVPASDAALIDPWFRLAFGCQFMTAVRETAGSVAPLGFGATIRTATRDDLPAFASFEGVLQSLQTGSPSFSDYALPSVEERKEEYAEVWDRPDSFWPFVAERDGQILGGVLMYRRPPGDLRIPEGNVDLAFAATRPEVRGSGVGVALTEHVLAWARMEGFRSMTVDWRSVNLLSSRFWPRRGFRPTFLRLYRSVP